jgi:Holliday junction DNA helicase RuvA
MIYSLQGKVIISTPTYSVIECAGVGYQINHSINTYDAIREKKEVFVLTHLIVREDAQILYGFNNQMEKDMFLLLLSVSGVGPNSARLILSHMTANDVMRVIGAGQSDALRAVKGIGAKTAERIIVDLKDKITAIGGEVDAGLGSASPNNDLMLDALSALEVLGYPKAAAAKAIKKVMQDPTINTVDQIIKHSLKNL